VLSVLAISLSSQGVIQEWCRTRYRLRGPGAPGRMHHAGSPAGRYLLPVGDLSEFPLKVRLFLKTYRWRRIDPVPWSPLAKPLTECRVALVSSAGFVTADQEPFDETKRGGDPSFRVIPFDVDLATLRDTHRSESFDHSGMRSDPNLALPVDRLRELAGTGRIGGVNSRHISFMGSLTATGVFVRDTAPAAARLFVEDGVDVALLVPV
jgi:D-proline reductase (dithiol) PrdB